MYLKILHITDNNTELDTEHINKLVEIFFYQNLPGNVFSTDAIFQNDDKIFDSI